MLTVSKISAHRIFVKSVHESKAWYQSLFGVPPSEDLADFCAFQINGTRLELVAEDPKNPYHLGGSICYWDIESLDEVLVVLSKIGGKLYRGPLVVPETNSKIMQVQDPFGNLIGFESKLSSGK